jgi:hypothetical protein
MHPKTMSYVVEDHSASAVQFSHPLDAEQLFDRLAHATPPPDDDDDRLDRAARSVLANDGGIPCDKSGCWPYWRLLRRQSTGVYCAQLKLWQNFRHHQMAQREKRKIQDLERSIRARRRQWSLEHVSVCLRLDVQEQRRWQTWVEFQDWLLQSHEAHATSLKDLSATGNNTAWTQGDRGRIIVVSRCFGTDVLPWTESVRLTLTAASTIKNTAIIRNRSTRPSVSGSRSGQNQRRTTRRVRRT